MNVKVTGPPRAVGNRLDRHTVRTKVQDVRKRFQDIADNFMCGTLWDSIWRHLKAPEMSEKGVLRCNTPRAVILTSLPGDREYSMTQIGF